MSAFCKKQNLGKNTIAKLYGHNYEIIPHILNVVALITLDYL